MDANIWFFGTGQFAARCLGNIAGKVRLSLVVTQPPARGGRGLKLHTSPVEDAALSLGLELVHSEAVNKDAALLERLGAEKPDLIFVIDFGQWIGEPWLSAPRLGCMNIHPSLLPQYRGAAPVQRALIDGCARTGVTAFRLVRAMDAGAVWLSEETEILPDEDFPRLRDRLSDIGCAMVCEHIGELLGGDAVFTEQDESGVSYAQKIDKSESALDAEKDARALHNLVRGLYPSPAAYAVHNGKRLKVLKSAVSDVKGTKGDIFAKDGRVYLGTADGSLELLTVQPEGKKAMDARDWARGAIRK